MLLKSIQTTLLLLAVSSISLNANPLIDKELETKQEIMQLNEQLHTAYKREDTQQLKTLLTEDYVHINSTGDSVDKYSLIEDIDAGILIFKT